MGHPGDVVRLGRQYRGAAEDIGNPGFASAVTVAVGVGEEERQPPAVLPLAAHEDTLPGDEYVVEDDDRIRDAVGAEGGRIRVILVPQPDWPCDHLDPVLVGGDGECDGVIRVLFHERPCRDHEEDVRIGRLGDGHLHPPHHDPVWSLLDDVDVGVGVLLLGGAFQPVSLGVGLGAGAVQVLRLIPLEVGEEPLVVLGPGGIVHLLGADGQGVDGVMSHAALDAASHPPRRQTDQLLLLQEVVRVLGEVVPAVDLLSCDRRGCRGESLPLGVPGEIKGHIQDVQTGTQAVVVSADLLPADVNISPHREQAVVILFFCS